MLTPTLADKADVLKSAHAAHRRLLGHKRVGLMHLIEVESADPEPLRAGNAALFDNRREGQQREQLCRQEHLLPSASERGAKDSLATGQSRRSRPCRRT